MRLRSPPAPRAVPAQEGTRAESTLAVLLGKPVFATVVPCQDPERICASEPKELRGSWPGERAIRAVGRRLGGFLRG